MSWKVTSVARERERFAAEWQQQRFDGAVNFAALCRVFGISRQTGYKWIARFMRARGDVRALQDRSRRPHTSPETTADAVVALLVKARKARPHWGPKTLRVWLTRQGTPSESLPAASTIGDILKREGLVRQRRRRTRTPPSMTRPSVEADCPNAVWGIDFKGWFKTADGMKCYPLTVVDAYSRFLVRCEATHNPDERFVRPVPAALQPGTPAPSARDGRPRRADAPSTRRFIDAPPDPSYPPTWDSRRASSTGHIALGGTLIFVGAALAASSLGFAPSTGFGSSSTSAPCCSAS